MDLALSNNHGRRYRSRCSRQLQFYFHQHNEIVPQIALKGATPKEVYEDKCLEKMRTAIRYGNSNTKFPLSRDGRTATRRSANWA